jgi:SAM-dependent methyltransferase
MKPQSTHFKQVASEYDELAANGLYATLAPNNKGGRKSEYVNAVFDAAILPRLPETGVCGCALDFGCGTGSFTRVLAQHCSQVIGVDVSEHMIATATQVCEGYAHVRLLQIDGESLPFENASFDHVIARESLCYVPDDMLGGVLEEIYRVLKPGGRFLWLEQVSTNPFWQVHPGAPNLVKRDPRVLRDELAQRGFKLLEQSMVRAPRFPWIYPLWFGLLPRRLIPALARWEVAWHRRFDQHPRRWWDALFIAERPRP